MTKQEKIDAIYDSDKIAGRFWGNRLEINLNEVLSMLYNWQSWEWKVFEENSQFPQIILKVCDLYENKRKPIEEQSEECISYIFNLLNEWKQ